MAKQTINPGVAPTGAGGDTFRSGSAKLQANDDEIYNYLGDGTNLNKLGAAAFKNVGTGTGNVMEVGAFGVGKVTGEDDSALKKNTTGFYNIGIVNSADTSGQPPNFAGVSIVWNSNPHAQVQFGANVVDAPIFGFRRWMGNNWGTFYKLYGTHNTTIDSNGFLKGASPVVQLFANKIELNDEAKQQTITFEKLGVGDYLVKGSSGFAQEGWYIETPKDANGNLLVAVVYEQLENGDISVKTYDYMLNNKGRIVADTETPLDIPESRWIDLRLQELPQPEIEVTDDPEQ